MIEAKAKARGIPFDQMYEDYVAQASMRRMVSAQDIANMILYLCADAGRLVSGQVIGVDGNIEALK